MLGPQLPLSHDPSLLWKEVFLILPKRYLPLLHLEAVQAAVRAELLSKLLLASLLVSLKTLDTKPEGLFSKAAKWHLPLLRAACSFHSVEIQALIRFREDHTVCPAYTLPSLSLFPPPPPL